MSRIRFPHISAVHEIIPIKCRAILIWNIKTSPVVWTICSRRDIRNWTDESTSSIGGIGKRCKYVDLENTLHEKRCFIQIRNNDDLCCAWAIVTAKARLDGHPKWNSIRLGKLEQELMARELHNTAGIPLQRCGIDEIKAFLTVLNGY
jgi:hypothetical protein